MSCCEDHHHSDHHSQGDTEGVTATERKFQEFLEAAAAPARWTERPSGPSPLPFPCWPAASRA